MVDDRWHVSIGSRGPKEAEIMDVSKEWRDAILGVDVVDSCSIDKRGEG